MGPLVFVYKVDILWFVCHSGLSGIVLKVSQKDSRRALLAGMTVFGFFYAFIKLALLGLYFSALRF